jgi:hypothetical protein
MHDTQHAIRARIVLVMKSEMISESNTGEVEKEKKL